MVWDYLDVANFMISLVLLAFTIGILLMLKNADPELLRARLFLERHFLYTTWTYILAAIIFIAIHNVAALIGEKYGIYHISGTLFLLFLGILVCQWFIIAKDCLKR